MPSRQSVDCGFANRTDGTYDNYFLHDLLTKAYIGICGTFKYLVVVATCSLLRKVLAGTQGRLTEKTAGCKLVFQMA